MCSRTIEVGEQYCRSFNIDGGDVWVWKECQHCSAMIAVLRKHFECYAYDEGYSQDAMSDFGPTTIAEARLKVCWKRRWRRPDGSLYTVPVAARAERVECSTTLDLR